MLFPSPALIMLATAVATAHRQQPARCSPCPVRILDESAEHRATFTRRVPQKVRRHPRERTRLAGPASCCGCPSDASSAAFSSKMASSRATMDRNSATILPCGAADIGLMVMVTSSVCRPAMCWMRLEQQCFDSRTEDSAHDCSGCRASVMASLGCLAHLLFR